MNNFFSLLILSLLAVSVVSCKKHKKSTGSTQEVEFNHQFEVIIDGVAKYTDSLHIVHYDHQLDIFPVMGDDRFYIRIPDTIKSGNYPLNESINKLYIYYQRFSSNELEYFDPVPGSGIKIISNDTVSNEIKAAFFYTGRNINQDEVDMSNGKLKFNY